MQREYWSDSLLDLKDKNKNEKIAPHGKGIVLLFLNTIKTKPTVKLGALMFSYVFCLCWTYYMIKTMTWVGGVT